MTPLARALLRAISITVAVIGVLGVLLVELKRHFYVDTWLAVSATAGVVWITAVLLLRQIPRDVARSPLFSFRSRTHRE